MHSAQRFLLVLLSLIILMPYPGTLAQANDEHSSDTINAGKSAIRLANGLRVILISQKTFPVVSCQLWYHIGSKAVDANEKGACYAIKHALDIQPALKQQSASLNLIKNAAQFDSFTADDFTAFVINADSEQLADCIKIQSERLKTTRLNAKQVKAGIAESIKNSEEKAKNSYFNRLRREVKALALPACKKGQALNNSHEEFHKASIKKVRKVFQESFLAAPATLVVAGKFDTEQTLKWIDQAFAGSRTISTSKLTSALKLDSASPSGKSFSRFISGNSNYMMLSFLTPPPGHKDIAPLVVLASLLNNKINGILKNRFQKEGNCKYTDAFMEMKSGPGLFTIYLASDTSISPELLLNDLDSLLDSLKQVPVDAISLRRAKRNVLLKFYKLMAGPYKTAYQYGFFDSIGSHSTLSNWDVQIEKVKDTDLSRVCRKYLINSNKNLGIFKAKDLSADNSEFKTIDSATATPVGMDQNKTGQDKSGEKSQKQGGNSTTGFAKLAGILVDRKTLANGIKLAVVTIPESKIVSIHGSLNCGYAFESPGKRGVSRLNTYAMNGDSLKISKNRSQQLQSNIGLSLPDLLEFNEEIEKTTFHTNCLAEKVGTQLKLISHHIRYPNLKPGKLARAKQAAVKSLESENQTGLEKPNSYLLRNLLAKNSVYTLPQSNLLAKSISNISVEDINEFRERTIIPSSMTLVAVGGISLDEMESKLMSIFADWHGVSNPDLPPAEKNKRQVLKVVIPKSDDQSEDIVLGRLIEKPFSESSPSILVANCALFNHPLYARLAKDKMASTYKCKSEKIGDKTLWSVSIETNKQNLEKAFLSLKNALVDISSNGIADTELENLKTYLKKRLTVSCAGNIFDLSRTLIDEAISNTPSDDVSSLNSSEVNEFIKNELSPKESCLVFELDRNTRSLVRKLNLHK